VLLLIKAYLPVENHSFFESLSLVDWLRQWVKTEEERDEVNIRSFLGKMIFSGEEALKNLSEYYQEEKKITLYDVRMMMEEPPTLMIDEPTNHLDLESIQAFNNSLKILKDL
jgi:ATPase subunit of ABC transporter with duplicated ATPase domains